MEALQIAANNIHYAIQPKELNENPPFQTISDDLYKVIFSSLSINDLKSISRVCKKFYQTSSADSLWKCFFEEYFPYIEKKEISVSYKSSLKQLLEQKQCLIKRISALKTTPAENVISVSSAIQKIWPLDNQRLATCDLYGEICEINAQQKKIEQRYDSPFGKNMVMTRLLPTGKDQYICQISHQKILLWDRRLKQCVFSTSIQPGSELIHCTLVPSLKGLYLAVASSKEIHLFDVTSKSLAHTLAITNCSACYPTSFNQRQYLIVAVQNAPIQLYDMETWTLASSHPSASNLCITSLMPTYPYLITASNNGKLQRWELDKPENEPLQISCHSRAICGVDLLKIKDFPIIATCGMDRKICLVNLRTMEKMTEITLSNDTARCVYVREEKNSLYLFAGAGKSLLRWDLSFLNAECKTFTSKN